MVFCNLVVFNSRPPPGCPQNHRNYGKLSKQSGKVMRFFSFGNMAKGRISKTEVRRIQSTPNFPKNERFLPPDTHTCVCVPGGKKRLFFGKFGVLCILVTSVLRFALLPYYRRLKSHGKFMGFS